MLQVTGGGKESQAISQAAVLSSPNTELPCPAHHHPESDCVKGSSDIAEVRSKLSAPGLSTISSVLLWEMKEGRGL